ncbi:TPA: ead/Ea22-like family protein [Klebsiella pneumoniae]|uniref:ead/Ea22-like family protein n=1 Tax=Klebsiella pneumoniae TaxID=573 RepID=UPI0021663F43|nr:ead/Ea22-like family protein [Klebsiella pneumoniae]
MKFLMFVAPCAAVITKPTIRKVTNAMKKPMTKLSVISAVSKVLTQTVLTTAARITPMSDITELAQRMKTAAEKLDADQWQTRKGFSGIEVIVKGSLEKGHGCVSFQPVAADMADTKTARAIALFSPANVLALVEALENSESRLHEVAVACATAEQALEKAQQQTTESENRVRKQNRHICELFDDNTALRQRIAGLESRTVTVKLPDINEYLAEVHDKTLNRAFRLLAEGVRAGDVAAMRAAGIKVEAE